MQSNLAFGNIVRIEHWINDVTIIEFQLDKFKLNGNY